MSVRSVQRGGELRQVVRGRLSPGGDARPIGKHGSKGPSVRGEPTRGHSGGGCYGPV